MTFQQFNAALERLGLSQTDFAKVIGLTDRMVRYYAVGHSKIPAPVSKLISLAVAGKVKVKDIERA